MLVTENTERGSIQLKMLCEHNRKTDPSCGAYSLSCLLASIEGLFKSEYVSDRLRKAVTPEEVIEAIRAGQEVGTDQGVQVDNSVLVQA